MLSRDSCLRPDAWNLLGTSGNVVEDPSAPFETTTPFYRGMLHERSPSAAFGGPGLLHPWKSLDDAEIRKEVINKESSLSYRRNLSTKLHG